MGKIKISYSLTPLCKWATLSNCINVDNDIKRIVTIYIVMSTTIVYITIVYNLLNSSNYNFSLGADSDYSCCADLIAI